MNAPEERFTNRVENYVKHRPSYPAAVIETLRIECGLNPESVVADVGAGTGIFSELLLEAGWRVIGVEPNEKMRRAAEERLGARREFESCAGSAEQTGLPDASVELVVAAQAFHWFRREEARREFARILRPGGWVALVWNQRDTSMPFLRAYEELLKRYSVEYGRSGHRNIDEAAIEAFFGGGDERVRRFVFPNGQRLDLTGLKGRVESSSYAPTPERPEYGPMMRALEGAFAAHAAGGYVEFGYETRLYFGAASVACDNPCSPEPGHIRTKPLGRWESCYFTCITPRIITQWPGKVQM